MLLPPVVSSTRTMRRSVLSRVLVTRRRLSKMSTSEVTLAPATRSRSPIAEWDNGSARALERGEKDAGGNRQAVAAQASCIGVHEQLCCAHEVLRALGRGRLPRRKLSSEGAAIDTPRDGRELLVAEELTLTCAARACAQ